MIQIKLIAPRTNSVTNTMMSAIDWKEFGNKAFNSGDYETAVKAYRSAELFLDSPVFGVGFDTDEAKSRFRSVLHSNQAAAFLKDDAFQQARAHASKAVKLSRHNVKARFRMASALYNLRSYKNALDVMRVIETASSPEIQHLHHKLITCVRENLYGEYEFAVLEEEAKQDPRLSHADYCSSQIELRRSTVGGNGGRGLFAKADVPAGTLLVASKSVCCVFKDEVPDEFLRTLTPKNLLLTDHYHKFRLAERVHTLLNKGCGRTILNLEGGPHNVIDVDLKRDDVYGADESVETPDSLGITKLIMLNSFAISRSRDDVEGVALFYVPSYINHSCMPNALKYSIGDMMFIRSSTDISAGEEIFIPYTDFLDGTSLEERNAHLNNRVDGFTCHCGLCEYERSNAAVVEPAVLLTRRMYEKYHNSERAYKSHDAIKELTNTRHRLYQLFTQPIPEYDTIDIRLFESKTADRFCLARLLKTVLWLLVSYLRNQHDHSASIIYCTELHSLVRGNLWFHGGSSVFDANLIPMYIWNYHFLAAPGTIHGPAASKWLEELKCFSEMVGGRKYYAQKGFEAKINELGSLKDNVMDQKLGAET